MKKKEVVDSYNGSDLVKALEFFKAKLGHYRLLRELKEFESELRESYEEKVKKLVFGEIKATMNCNISDFRESGTNCRVGKRSAEKQYAISFACTILKDEYGFSLKKIAELFNIHTSNVSRKINFVRTLNPNSYFDSKILTNYKKIIGEIKDKK